MFQGLNDMLSGRTVIGLKRMGELDQKVFVNVCKKKLPLKDAETKGVELCSLWQENLKNPGWHPFRVIKDGDKVEACPLRLAFFIHNIYTLCLFSWRWYN